MIKISVNLDERDVQMIDKLASSDSSGRKSDIIRTAIHEYCEKAAKERTGVTYAIDAAFGVFKEDPLDADALRKDSNECSRV